MTEKKSITQRFVDWCADPAPSARLQRTIAQGVIGVGIGCLTSISGAPEWVNMAVVPLAMAVLSPIQAEIGKGNADIKAGGTDD